jgi:DNA-binding PucR family transcriptional regulator
MTPDAIVEFAEGLARVAASGGGPTALVVHLAELARAPVMLEDAEWRPIATAGPGSLPPSARGLASDMATVLPVTVGADPVAWLALFGRDAERTRFELAARLTASAIAVELARNGRSTQSKKSAFWEAILAGSYHDAAAIRADAHARGITVADAYVCIALDAEAGTSELRALVSESFRSAPGELIFLEQGATLIVLAPAAREVDAENAKTMAKLLPHIAAKRKSNAGTRGGISGAVAPLCITRGVRDARAALAISARMFDDDAVVAHDDLGAYPLVFNGASVEEFREFSARTLATLRSYDEKHQTELERTLRRYFATGMNVKTTAAELNVHRHTVFYRLRQIGEISGRSLESDHDQLTLRLAIAIDALHT